jgi:hypothetical protein
MATRTHDDLVGPLKAVGKFIGWLSGSLAAISGVLYGLGYLVTLSNLYSLGLNFYLFDFDPSFYLTRGANFVLYFTRWFFQTLLYLIVLISPILLLGFGVYRRRAWISDRLPAKGRAAVDYVRNRPLIWRGVLFAALFAVLVQDVWVRFEGFSTILDESHNLFDPLESGPQEPGSQKSEPRKPGEVILFYQLFLIEAAVLLYLAWRVTAAWRFRALMAAPFALVLAMSVVTLPMIYGILVISNEFPAIRVITGEPGAETRSSELYLLSKTDNEFILWDSNNRKVLWLPLSSVRRAEIGRSKALPARAKSDDGKAP